MNGIGATPHSNLNSNPQGKLRSEINSRNIPTFQLKGGRNKQKTSAKIEANS